MDEFLKSHPMVSWMLAGVAFLVAFVLILKIIEIVADLRRRLPKGSRSRQLRLGFVETFDLDGDRQLLLVRRDNVEHLVMIGGPNDVLVESGIVRVEPRESRLSRAGEAHLAPPPADAAAEPGALEPPPAKKAPQLPPLAAAAQDMPPAAPLEIAPLEIAPRDVAPIAPETIAPAVPAPATHSPELEPDELASPPLIAAIEAALAAPPAPPADEAELAAALHKTAAEMDAGRASPPEPAPAPAPAAPPAPPRFTPPRFTAPPRPAGVAPPPRMAPFGAAAPGKEGERPRFVMPPLARRATPVAPPSPAAPPPPPASAPPPSFAAPPPPEPTPAAPPSFGAPPPSFAPAPPPPPAAPPAEPERKADLDFEPLESLEEEMAKLLGRPVNK